MAPARWLKGDQMSIYTEMKNAGLEMANHESDLYVENTPKAREILKIHGNTSWSVFVNQITKTMWIDVPFMYSPYWGEVEKKNIERGGK